MRNSAMATVAQGSLGENLKFDWMSAPHTTVVVPVTATAANRARTRTGSRFHIDRSQLVGGEHVVVVIHERASGNVFQSFDRDLLLHRSVSGQGRAPQAYGA